MVEINNPGLEKQAIMPSSLVLNKNEILIALLLLLLSLILVGYYFGDFYNSSAIGYLNTFIESNPTITIPTIAGFFVAFTILIGGIITSKPEDTASQEDKILAGAMFWNNTLLALFSFFALVYGVIYQRVWALGLFLLSLDQILLWLSFSTYTKNQFSWNVREAESYQLSIYKYSSPLFYFLSGFLLTLFAIEVVQNSIILFIYLWAFFSIVLFYSAFYCNYVRKVKIEFNDGSSEFAYLVVIKDGFIRVFTKDAVSRVISLDRIKHIDYVTVDQPKVPPLH
jgi:hypothetical protein